MRGLDRSESLVPHHLYALARGLGGGGGGGGGWVHIWMLV